MAIVTEDGTGLANAVAYINVSFADAYHAARGRTDWAALGTPAKETSIVRATDYIDLRFGRRFRGARRSQAQSLQWPRYSSVDNSGWLLDGVDIIPRQLQKACAEYALISARTDIELAANPAAPNGTQAVTTGVVTASSGTTGVVTSTRKVVGPLEIETRYDTKSGQSFRYGAGGLVSAFNIPEYPMADQWLAELLRSTLSGDLARA